MPAEHARPGDGRWANLAYDVAVNVTANLIAAAVVYVAAAYGGLVPSSRPILGFSLIFLIAPLVLAGTRILEQVDTPARPRRALFVSLISAMAFTATVMFVVTVSIGIMGTPERSLAWLSQQGEGALVILTILTAALYPCFRYSLPGCRAARVGPQGSTTDEDEASGLP